jgi:hypothetical protein
MAVLEMGIIEDWWGAIKYGSPIGYVATTDLATGENKPLGNVLSDPLGLGDAKKRLWYLAIAIIIIVVIILFIWMYLKYRSGGISWLH